MAVIIPIEEIEVSGFYEFCQILKIKTFKIAGDDGTDEELIIEELNKLKDKKFIINFIDDSSDGYFKIQQFK